MADRTFRRLCILRGRLPGETRFLNDSGTLEQLYLARRSAVRAGENPPQLALKALRVVTANVPPDGAKCRWQRPRWPDLAGIRSGLRLCAYVSGSFSQVRPQREIDGCCINNSITRALKNCGSNDGHYATHLAVLAVQKVLKRHQGDPECREREAMDHSPSCSNVGDEGRTSFLGTRRRLGLSHSCAVCPDPEVSRS